MKKKESRNERNERRARRDALNKLDRGSFLPCPFSFSKYPPKSAERHFEQALVFDHASCLLDTHWTQTNAKLIQQNSLLPQPYVIPTVVVRSFSIELYLKCELAIERKEVESHELDYLFGELSPDAKAEIEKNYNALHAFQVDAIRRQHPQAAADCSRSLEVTLEVRLRRGAEAFTAWRYAHENSTLPAAPPPDILEAIYLRIVRVRPEFVAIKKAIWPHRPSLPMKRSID